MSAYSSVLETLSKVPDPYKDYYEKSKGMTVTQVLDFTLFKSPPDPENPQTPSKMRKISEKLIKDLTKALARGYKVVFQAENEYYITYIVSRSIPDFQLEWEKDHADKEGTFTMEPEVVEESGEDTKA